MPPLAHVPRQPLTAPLRPRASVLRRVCGLALALAALLLPEAADAQAVSRAETLLFETDHLARIAPPAVLVYTFSKISNVEPGFTDKVQLDLAGAKGKTSATLHFLSGEHRHDIPALDDVHGNPVLLGFLERDIAEMKRLTGGSTAYFRKRIRMALAQEAQVSAQPITYQGKAIRAQAVQIQPYLNDPMHARFEPYIHKTYTFIVSEQVPGGVYQLCSSLANRGEKGAAGAPGGTAAARAAAGQPAAGAQARGNPGPAPGAPLPAIDETLTLVSVSHPAR